MTLKTQVERYIEFKRRLGYKYVEAEKLLLDYANFAAIRTEEFMRIGTMVDWAARASSRNRSCTKLDAVRLSRCSYMAKTNVMRFRRAMSSEGSKYQDLDRICWVKPRSGA